MKKKLNLSGSVLFTFRSKKDLDFHENYENIQKAERNDLLKTRLTSEID